MSKLKIIYPNGATPIDHDERTQSAGTVEHRGWIALPIPKLNPPKLESGENNPSFWFFYLLRGAQ